MNGKPTNRKKKPATVATIATVDGVKLTEPKPIYQENDTIPLESFGVLTVQNGDVIVFRTSRKIAFAELEQFAKLAEMIEAHTSKNLAFVVLDDGMDLAVLR